MSKPMSAREWHRNAHPAAQLWASDVYKFSDAYARYRVNEALERAARMTKLLATEPCNACNAESRWRDYGWPSPATCLDCAAAKIRAMKEDK